MSKHKPSKQQSSPLACFWELMTLWVESRRSRPLEPRVHPSLRLRQKQMQTASRYFPTEDVSYYLNWLSSKESHVLFFSCSIQVLIRECVSSKFWAYLSESACRCCGAYSYCMLLLLVSGSVQSEFLHLHKLYWRGSLFSSFLLSCCLTHLFERKYLLWEFVVWF